MRAVTWRGKRDVRVEEVPDPAIEAPTDAIVRVTSSGICGSDLHLYEVLTPLMDAGDVLGHEPIGIVEEVGMAVERIAPGDRVVIPFPIACGDCWMCDRELYTQCETTQVHEFDKAARIYGYSKLYGAVPGAQAEYLRVQHADFNPIKVPQGPSDERFVYLSDILPTAWQSVVYADAPKDGTLAVFGLGPVGQFATRIARNLGVERVVGLDLVPERLDMAQRHGIQVVDVSEVDDVPEVLRDLTDGRGPDAVIDAVGLEAHGSPIEAAMQTAAGMLPDTVAEPLSEKAGVDRLNALLTAIDSVRRGGTLSIVGVYGGAVDPMPMLQLFDKQVQIRMGQCNVQRWIDDLLPLVTDDADPLGTEDLATHHLPLEQAPTGYDIFQRKVDGSIKVLLRP